MRSIRPICSTRRNRKRSKFVANSTLSRACVHKLSKLTPFIEREVGAGVPLARGSRMWWCVVVSRSSLTCVHPGPGCREWMGRLCACRGVHVATWRDIYGGKGPFTPLPASGLHAWTLARSGRHLVRFRLRRGNFQLQTEMHWQIATESSLESIYRHWRREGKRFL